MVLSKVYSLLNSVSAIHSPKITFRAKTAGLPGGLSLLLGKDVNLMTKLTLAVPDYQYKR